MNALELKGGMIEMIAGINNELVLQQLFDVVAATVKNATSDATNLATEEQTSFNMMIEVEPPVEPIDWDLLIKKDNHLLNPNTVYHFHTPYHTYGAADHLMAALQEDKNKR